MKVGNVAPLIIQIVGLAAFVYGVSLLSLPAAWIVGGALAVAVVEWLGAGERASEAGRLAARKAARGRPA